MIAAVILTAAIQIEIDIGSLIAAHRENKWRHEAGVNGSRVTCGIRTVGYRWRGKPGTQVRYYGRTYVIGSEGYVELIAGRRVPPGAEDEHDQFGFRDVKAER